MAYGGVTYRLPYSRAGFTWCTKCGDIIFQGTMITVIAVGHQPLMVFHPDCSNPDESPIGDTPVPSEVPAQ